MSKLIKIKGKAFFKDIGPGAWGISTIEGKEYRPISMPEQLKHDGAQVTCTAVEIEEDISIHMWGTPIKIISFHTTVK